MLCISDLCKQIMVEAKQDAKNITIQIKGDSISKCPYQVAWERLIEHWGNSHVTYN